MIWDIWDESGSEHFAKHATKQLESGSHYGHATEQHEYMQIPPEPQNGLHGGNVATGTTQRTCPRRFLRRTKRHSCLHGDNSRQLCVYIPLYCDLRLYYMCICVLNHLEFICIYVNKYVYIYICIYMFYDVCLYVVLRFIYIYIYI